MYRAFATALIAIVAQADDAHDDAKIAGLVQGFFVGAFDFHGMTDVAHCVSDANPVEQHFENAMRGFWNGSYQEATKAIDQLGLAVSDIGDMLDHCGKIDHHDYEQIQRMSESFLHPKQILLESNESLIVNGVNVFEDTREGVHDYRMGKWVDAGEHFGQAAAMLLYGKTQMVDHQELFFDFDNHWQELLDQIDHEKDEKMHHFEAMKSSNVHFTFFRMGKILEGLLAGAVEAEVPHGVECLRDAKHIWERFGGVIDQLKHATFNSVLHAVEDLGHILHDIANELEECKATVGTDLDKLREMSKAFTDPWYFIFHVEHDLIVNGQDIHHEITDAQAQWDNQHFYEFGHSIGLGLSKIFLGGKMKNDIPAHYLPTEHRAYGHNAPLSTHEPVHGLVTDHNPVHPIAHGTVHSAVKPAHHGSVHAPVHETVHAPVHATVHVPIHNEEEVNYSHGYDHGSSHGYSHGEHGSSHGYAYGDHGSSHGYAYGDHSYSHGDAYGEHGYGHGVERREHLAVHEEAPVHHEVVHHEGVYHDEHVHHHDEPRVLHDHPVHHEEPHITYRHDDYEYHQEEPHVEFEHQAHGGPVHHEPAQYVPKHSHTDMDTEHHFSPAHDHKYYSEHEGAHHAEYSTGHSDLHLTADHGDHSYGHGYAHGDLASHGEHGYAHGETGYASHGEHFYQ